ncbi:MAG: transposase [Dermatophilaceae bacterium]
MAQLRRTVTTAGKKTIEVVYLITSATHHDAPSATLAAWVQHHWHVENKLHWVRDVTYDEDRFHVRTGHAPQVMTSTTQHRHHHHPPHRRHQHRRRDPTPRPQPPTSYHMRPHLLKHDLSGAVARTPISAAPKAHRQVTSSARH